MEFHDFSRCALAPPQRGRRRKNTKNNIKTTSNISRNMFIFLLFSCRQALQQKCSHNDVPEALRDPPGDPLGASGDTLGGPRRPQEAPRATPEGPRSRPGPPRSGPQRPPKPASAPGGLRGAILEPFWHHFGASGGRFSSLRRLIFERPGGIFGIIFGALCRHVLERSRRILPRETSEKNDRNAPSSNRPASPRSGRARA